MAISDTINSLKKHIGNAYTAIGNKKGTVPTNKNCENLQAAIESISTGKQEQAKTVTITENGIQKALPDENKVLTEVTIVTNVPATPTQEKTVDLAMASGDQTITPTSGKVLSSVVVKKPATMLPENIAKDVNIGGVVGTLESGGSAELNIAYSDTAPEDTSKLWVNARLPSKVTIANDVSPTNLVEQISKLDTDLPKDFYGNAFAAVGNKIYLFLKNTLQVWDVASGEVDASFTTEIYFDETRTASAVGNNIFLFGGSSSSSSSFSDAIYKFNTSTNTMETLETKMPVPILGAKSVSVGSKIYIFGGRVEGPTDVNSIYIFDTETSTVTRANVSLSVSQMYPGVAAVGKRIYIFESNKRIQMIDVDNMTSITTISAQLYYPAWGITAVTVGTKIYLFGGYDTRKFNTGIQLIQCLDTTTDTVRPLSARFPHSRMYYAGGVNIDDSVYLFGSMLYSKRRYKFIPAKDPLTNNIIVSQGAGGKSFQLMSGATELDTNIKNIFIGDTTTAAWAPAYLYDGTNWYDVNSGYVYFNKLYPPVLSIEPDKYNTGNDILTITLAEGNSEVGYFTCKLYDGSTLLTSFERTYETDFPKTVTLTPLNMTTGTHNLQCKLIATYRDKDITWVEPNYSNTIEYKVYNLETDLTRMTKTSTISKVSNYFNQSIYFKPEEGWTSPAEAIVTGASYIYTNNNYNCYVRIYDVVDTVRIKLSASSVTYNITPSLLNVTASSSNPTTISSGESKDLYFTASQGYNLPEAISAPQGATFAWDKDTGKLTISNPTSNVTFGLQGDSPAIQKYAIKITNTGSYSMAFTQNQITVATVDSGANVTVDLPAGILTGNTGANYMDSETQVTGGITVDNASSTGPVFTITGAGTITVDPWCLIEGTQITLADGSTKAIEDITYDDKLLVWNFYDGKFDKAKPTWIKVAGVASRYNLVKFSNGSEVGFVGAGGEKGYHRIFNKEAGAFPHTGVADTPNGTTTFAQDETFPTVVSQEVVEKEVKFYNVITENHYNLFANGILTSCRLSNKYRIEDMRYIGEKLISDEQEKAYFKRIENKRK